MHEADGPVWFQRLTAVSAALSKTLFWIAGSGLVLMSVIVLWQVFARYVLNASPAWSEQAALYLLVWTVLLGSAAGVREGFHIRITLSEDYAPATFKAGVRYTNHIVTIIIGCLLVFFGAKVVIALWAHNIPALIVPRGSAFLPLPIAGALIVFFSFEQIVSLMLGRKVEQTWH